MAIQKSSKLMTVGGIMAAFGVSLGGLPIIVIQAYAQVVKDGVPHWFSVLILPMLLVGSLLTAGGTAVMGVAGRGQDDVPTIPQVEAATVKAVANKVVELTDAKPAEMPAVPVVIVKPKEGE